jgi:hypothetical protein
VPHRFNIGQLVTYATLTTVERSIPFVITEYRPEEDGERRYKMKRPSDDCERVASESELLTAYAHH